MHMARTQQDNKKSVVEIATFLAQTYGHEEIGEFCMALMQNEGYHIRAGREFDANGKQMWSEVILVEASFDLQSHGWDFSPNHVAQIVWEEGPMGWAIQFASLWNMLHGGYDGSGSFCEPYNHFVLDVFPPQ